MAAALERGYRARTALGSSDIQILEGQDIQLPFPKDKSTSHKQDESCPHGETIKPLRN